jgi:hypothetical protein
MSRAMVPLVLVFVLNLVSVSNHAIAFTVRFGPVPVTEGLASPDETADADLPTPRMFNVTVGAAGVAFGPIAAPPEATVIAAAVSARGRAQPRFTDKQSIPPARMFTSSRHLSGLEIRLLRHAKQVARR